jgi:hypothetical protein
VTTGTCRYQYNASEQYRLRGPGGGNESHCGSKTYAIADEPEIVPVTVRPDNGNPYIDFVKTGVLLPREHPDPYCPRHGGTGKPEARIVMQAEVIDAARKSAALQAAYDAQLNKTVPAAITPDGEPAVLKVDLQDQARELGLPVSGTKAQLADAIATAPTLSSAKEVETNG